MKNMARYVSIALVVVFLYGLFGGYAILPAKAIEIDLNTNIQTQGINDLTVQAAINRYFAQREAFLKGETQNIAIAVLPMATDELNHRNKLAAAEMRLADSSVQIDTIDCGETQAQAVVTETMAVEFDGELIYESVEHSIWMYLDDSEGVRVSGDGYETQITGFVSCSFVDEEAVIDINAAGSPLCITAVAESQIGEGEDANHMTKYGIWYTDFVNNSTDYSAVDWCAMFVSWCAYNANISNSVIQANASAPLMRDFFNTQGRYSRSKGWNSSTTFTPQAGDVIFMNNTPEHPYHVGIVTGVSGGYVYYIDGNSSQNGGDVRWTSGSLSATYIVGYARPGYTNNQHTASAAWSKNTQYHWHYCANCNEVLNMDLHTIRWSINSQNHTRYCADCGYSATSTHNLKLNSEGESVCQDCGYVDAAHHVNRTPLWEIIVE